MALFINPHNSFILTTWNMGEYLLITDPMSPDTCEETWMKIPYELAKIAELFTINHKHSSNIIDPRRAIDVLTVATAEDDETFLFEFRAQGIIRSLALSPGGNWDGKASGKTQARQFVEIGDPGTSGGLPWINQCASIAKLRFAVLRSIPGVNARDIELEQDTRDALYIARQAFIRDKTRAYRFADAPRLDLSARQDDGSLKAAGQLDFNIGDFVDVLVGLEVTKTGRRVQVHLFLSGITQLLSAERIEMATAATTLPQPPSSPRRRRARSGLTQGASTVGSVASVFATQVQMEDGDDLASMFGFEP